MGPMGIPPTLCESVDGKHAMWNLQFHGTI